MTPEGDGREQIIVSERVETDEDGLETERYLHASNCEGEIWSSCLAKEVVLEANVTELRALARILWHITFWGFTPEGEVFNDYEKSPMNEYERKAFTLRISFVTMPVSNARETLRLLTVHFRSKGGKFIIGGRRAATGQSVCEMPGRTVK